MAKRKYKNVGIDGSRVTKWWFVLRASETILQTLEKQWPKIHIQTAWRIGPVYYNPVDNAPQSLAKAVLTIHEASTDQPSPSGSHAAPAHELDSDATLSPLAAVPLQEEGEDMLQHH